MKQEELEEKVMALLCEVLIAENAGERVCECGQIILDRNKSAAAIESVMTIVADYLISFAIVADDPGARLHVPDPTNKKTSMQLH